MYAIMKNKMLGTIGELSLNEYEFQILFFILITLSYDLVANEGASKGDEQFAHAAKDAANPISDCILAGVAPHQMKAILSGRAKVVACQGDLYEGIFIQK